METKTMQTTWMFMPQQGASSAASLRAARPILRDLSASAQGTGVSSSAHAGVDTTATLTNGAVRPKGGYAFVINPIFADGVGRFAAWSPPV